MDRLREALAELEDRVPPGWTPYNADVLVRKTARVVADAETVWWCEVHRQGNGRTWCKEHDGCGWRLLVDPGKLA